MKSLSINIHVVFLLFVLFGFHVSNKGEAADQYSSIAPMEEKEQEALYSAIQGFVGKWWNGSDLYPDPCGWTPIQGVSCDLYNGFWYVTVLNIGSIYDNSLKCTQNPKFKHQLFDLHHLKTLTFSSCFLSPQQNPITIPTSSSWKKLANSLESLEFRSNPGLIETIPTTIGSLIKLQSLVLQKNGLSGELPITLGNLINLKQLVLSGNRFAGQIPASIGGLTNLLIFDSSMNFLSGSLPLTLGGLTSLLKLDLSNNLLESELPREIGHLKNVTLLDLGNNNFSGGLIQTLEEMVSIQNLVLSNNPLVGGDLMSIKWQNLQNLEILDLSNMSLTGEIPESMAELKRLRFLGLNNNKLTGTISPRLASLPCLRTLYLNGNNLTGELEFSEWFYKKLGRRFGAWNNQNLCYGVELILSSHVPYGVKPCQIMQGINVTERDLDQNLNQNSYFVASLGFSSCGVGGSWWVFMVKEMLTVLLFNMLL